MDRYLLLGVLVLSALLSAPASARGELALPSGFSTVALASGLADPTALAYTPDGRMLITEKAGRVRVVSPAGALASAPVIDISGHVATQGDRGLLGIAVDSAFATNNYVYLLYTYDADQAHPGAAKTARLTRIRLLPDNTLGDPLSPETVLLGTTGAAPCPAPANNIDCIPSTSDSHSIGTVRSAPDGTLWVGSGDGASYSTTDPAALRTFNEQSLSGKILHIDRNGSGLPGHPFCPGETNLDLVCTKLYAMGFRNPFRFNLRPGRTPVVGDVGWGLTEELDFVEPGRSYGWPCYEGPDQTFGYRHLPECEAQYAGGPPAHSPPVLSYSHNDEGAGAVAAGPQYTGTRYPESYRDAWFFADYAQGWIKLYDLVDGKPANVRTLAASGYVGVDLETTPEGDLVYVSFGDGSANSGSVERIVYGNAPPPASAHAAPQSGPSPLEVAFTADESIDPDGDGVTYEWDFESDGGKDADGRTATHTYTQRGAHTATLTVRDARGLASSDTVVVLVDETPPVATVEAPADGALFRHGEPVELRGSGHDDEDGELTGDALRWRIVLHHGSHLHLAGPDLLGAEQSFTPAGDHDADSYYEIQFSARDSAGQTDTRRIDIHPETVTLTLASSPPGVPLSYSGREFITPAPLTAAIGYRTSVSAPESFTRGAATYRFAGWSDGGARLHDIVVPSAVSTLTAAYRADPGDSTSPPAPAAQPPVAPTTGRPPAAAARVRIGVSRARRGTRVLRGRVTGLARAPRVLVALRTPRGAGRCRRWSRDAGRLGRPVPGCERRPVWMRAHVAASGAASWRWRVRLGGAARRGRYVVTTRVTDRRGRLRLGSATQRLRLR